MPTVPPGYISGVNWGWIMTLLLLPKYITLLSPFAFNIAPTLLVHRVCCVLCVVSSSSQAFAISPWTAPLSMDIGAMELVPELVADSKLDTIFKKGFTIHHIRTPDTTPLLGKNKKKQKWEQSKELGQGSFGFVYLQKLVGGGDSDAEKRAVKKIKKGPKDDYRRELYAIAKFSQERVSILPFGFKPWPIKLCRVDVPMNTV